MSIVEISRENGLFDTVEFSIRYTRLTEMQRSEVEKEFKRLKTDIRTGFSGTNGYVVSIVLDKSINPTTIKNLNDRLSINETDFGIWVSLTTYYDHSGVSFPDYVIELIRTVGGQVDVSTIMISNDE